MTIKMFVQVFAVLYSVNGHGGIYKCIDAKSHVIYSDAACSTKGGRLAIEVSPEQKASQSTFFFVATEKIKSFIKRFSKDRTTGSELPINGSSAKLHYQCDGRIYCSQMASCAEATFFINNCSGTKMDGDNDGIPCESQWCQ